MDNSTPAAQSPKAARYPCKAIEIKKLGEGFYAGEVQVLGVRPNNKGVPLAHILVSYLRTIGGGPGAHVCSLD